MIISFAAIFTSLVTVSVLVGLLALILHVNRYGFKFRYEYVLFICFAIIGRLLIPFEWPWTYTLLSQKIMPPIYNFFHQKIYQQISLMDILLMIWLVGASYFLLRELNNLRKIARFSRILPNQLTKYQQDFPFLADSSLQGVYQLTEFAEPLVMNPFQPAIYLPTLEYSQEELSFILLHEMQHIKNKDLYLKFFVQLLVIVYWWFPGVYLLRSMFDYILELRVDHQVTQHFSDKKKLCYLQALVSVARKIPNSKPKYLSNTASQFTLRKENLLQKRIFFYFEDEVRKKYRILMLIPVIFVVLAMPSVVFQPYTPAKSDPKEHIYSETDMEQYLYIVHTKEGKYYLHSKKTQQQLASISQKAVRSYPFTKLQLIEE